MKLLGKLTLFLGGLFIMTALQACGPADPSITNRSVGQYSLEQEFQPLFDFLAQEKKDFSDVNKYQSTIYEMDLKSDVKKSYTVLFDKLPNSMEGTYTITENNEETKYPISLDNRGNLTYSSPVPKAFDQDIFNLTLKEGFFQELTISDYLANHPKTYLKDIVYGFDDRSKYFTDIKKKYDFKKDAYTMLSVQSSEYHEYEISIDISDDNKSIGIFNVVTFRESDDKMD